jgi:hypothetical protein
MLCNGLKIKTTRSLNLFPLKEMIAAPVAAEKNTRIAAV